ncbi:hypothetical protein [Weissella cibaria]|uniref:hypothetical protein n=1 Tax=Weissella cibaria TaxID=137591 RepID=UPI002A748F6F|nr:hypothetical protein [Weissella cibaria]MDY2520204.1 hypothetical protein [Weissella cibaria]
MKVWHNKWVRWVWYNTMGLFCLLYIFHVSVLGIGGWIVTLLTISMLAIAVLMMISTLLRHLRSFQMALPEEKDTQA